MASEKVTAIVEELKGLTVLELSELVHAVEDEFGVSAAAAVAVAFLSQCRQHVPWRPSCGLVPSCVHVS